MAYDWRFDLVLGSLGFLARGVGVTVGVCLLAFVLAFLIDERKKTYNFYIGGRDESFKGPPTGLVLHAYAIRHAIANGFTKYDFLRGN